MTIDMPANCPPLAAQPSAAATEGPQRIDSHLLLRGQRTVEIDHGEHRYTLRVTRDNKLILTK